MIRCQAIVRELMSSPHRDKAPEIVDKVVNLYLFIHSRLVEAQMQRDLTKLDDAIQILEIERDTWRQLCSQLDSASVPRAHFNMQNSAESSSFSAEA